MFVNKYKEGYLKVHDTKNNQRVVVSNIGVIEEEFNMNLTEWGNEQLISFLKKSGTISVSTIKMHLSILNKFSMFVCKEENIEIVSFSLGDDVDFFDLVDKDALLSLTISYDQFQSIRKQMSIVQEGETMNYRDKVIFELAWHGLTENEIRMLKNDDISFLEETGEAALSTVTDRVVIIEDLETIEDIKQCMITTEIMVKGRDGRVKVKKYKESDYLIKSGVSGKPSSGYTYANKPASSLKSAFKNREITCEGIDMEHLGLDDIRRSGLVLLLAPKNRKYCDLDAVVKLYNFSSYSGLKGYQDLAVLKYGEV